MEILNGLPIYVIICDMGSKPLAQGCSADRVGVPRLLLRAMGVGRSVVTPTPATTWAEPRQPGPHDRQLPDIDDRQLPEIKARERVELVTLRLVDRR